MESEALNYGRTSTLGAAGVYRDQSTDKRPGLVDALSRAHQTAAQTFETLANQHERLVGAPSARPEAISQNKLPGPPTLADSLDNLNDLLDRMHHVANSLANRI